MEMEQMSRNEIATVTAFHRSIWCRCKRKRSLVCICPSPIDDLSVLALMKQGYGATDIALMFGVSRERVRQIAKRQGRTIPRTRPRVWDDNLNRFRPISTAERDLRRILARRMLRRRITFQKMKRRRDHDLNALKILAAMLDRTPTLQEFVKARGMTIPGITLHWGREQRKRAGGYREAVAKLYEAAGLEVRPSGYPGHVR